MTELTCVACHGYRLNPAALSVKVNGQHIAEVSEKAVTDELAFLNKLRLGNKMPQLPNQSLKKLLIG